VSFDYNVALISEIYTFYMKNHEHSKTFSKTINLSNVYLYNNFGKCGLIWTLVSVFHCYNQKICMHRDEFI